MGNSNQFISLIIGVIVAIIGLAIIGGTLDPYTQNPGSSVSGAIAGGVPANAANLSLVTTPDSAGLQAICNTALETKSSEADTFYQATPSSLAAALSTGSGTLNCTVSQRYTGAIQVLNLLPLALIGAVIAIAATMFMGNRRSSYA